MKETEHSGNKRRTLQLAALHFVVSLGVLTLTGYFESDRRDIGLASQTFVELAAKGLLLFVAPLAAVWRWYLPSRPLVLLSVLGANSAAGAWVATGCFSGFVDSILSRRRLMNALKAILVILALPYVAFYAFLAASDGPSRAWRHLLGEPRATQDVNDAADWLLVDDRAKELERVADDIARDFGPRASELPLSFLRDPLVPLERLPPKFLVLGGRWHRSAPEQRAKYPPEFVLILDESKRVKAVEIQWGHRRHRVTIFTHPPKRAPRGFATRRVSARIYVGAIES